MKHIGIFSNSGDVQTALNEETLVNPYVALVSGALDYDTAEQQSCQERGLCGDDPTDCHECTCEEQFSDPAEICACEGGYYWGGECHDEPEPEEPCAGMEQDIADCEGRGGIWDYVNCMCNEPEDPCGGDPECECIQMGGSWEGSECVMPSDEQ